MVAGCISGTASLSAKSLMICLSLGDQPKLVCGVKPLGEHTRAIQKGEKIWHEEDQLCRIQVLLGWLQA